jgi:hypothetical protein
VFKFPSAAVAAAVLTGAAAGISGCGPRSSVTQEYAPTVPVSSLIVNDTVGSVSVSSGPGSGVSVTATISYGGSRPSLTHAISGQTLTLGHSACTSCGVAFAVTVPRMAAVAIRLRTGNVTVADLGGDLSVVDDTGAVTMTSLIGDVFVQVSTGSVNGTGLSAMRASFQSRTGSIDVAFTAAPRQLSAVNGTGRVAVRLPSGTAYHVDASSQTGKVDVSVPRSSAVTHMVTAATITGRVSVSDS